MNRSPAHRPDIEELVEAYRGDLVAAGMFAGHPVTSVARTFFTRVGVDGWARLPLAQQCALPLKDRRVVGWLIVTGRVRPSPDYLVACRPYLGEVAAMDAQLARLVTAFRQTAAGPIAVVCVGDHGEGLGDHGEAQHGNLVYQSTMHVPLAIAGPGLAAGVTDRPVSTRRVFHTILDWAGVDAAFQANADPLAGADARLELRELFRRITALAPAPIGVGPAGRKGG